MTLRSRRRRMRPGSELTIVVVVVALSSLVWVVWELLRWKPGRILVSALSLAVFATFGVCWMFDVGGRP